MSPASISKQRTRVVEFILSVPCQREGNTGCIALAGRRYDVDEELPEIHEGCYCYLMPVDIGTPHNTVPNKPTPVPVPPPPSDVQYKRVEEKLLDLDSISRCGTTVAAHDHGVELCRVECKDLEQAEQLYAFLTQIHRHYTGLRNTVEGLGI